MINVFSGHMPYYIFSGHMPNYICDDMTEWVAHVYNPNECVLHNHKETSIGVCVCL